MPMSGRRCQASGVSAPPAPESVVLSSPGPDWGHMRRASERIGVVVAILASAWLAGGAAGLHRLLTGTAQILPFCCIALAGWIILRLVLPSGTLAGPISLLAIGIGVMLLKYGLGLGDQYRTLSAVGVIGGLAMAWRVGGLATIVGQPHARISTLWLPRTVILKEEAPLKLRVTAAARDRTG